MSFGVSFGVPSGRDCKPRTTSAGSSLNTLKKENGAALTTPSLPTVVTRAIGRGTTSAGQQLIAKIQWQRTEVDLE